MPTASPYAEAYVELLNEKFPDYEFTTKGGNKLDRIFQENRKYGGGSIHCFIEKATGHVYKAAGLNQPAKGIRFTNIFDAIEKADPHTSYLYAR